MRLSRALTASLVATLVAAVYAGCGGSDQKATTNEPVRTETGPAFHPSTTTTPGGQEGNGGTKRVKLDVPRGWSTPKPHSGNRIWPEPVKVLSSFAIARLPTNAACPKDVLDRMPPDGVYVLVSEYTQPRPANFPAARKLGPRPDLRKLDLRQAEVECWDHGLSGTADFAEHGRGFHVEILLGSKVTKAQRQRALATLASLRIG